MFDYYFTFRSVTPAQRAQALLRELHIPSEVRRLPKFLSGRGCGYAVVVDTARGIPTARALQSAGVSYGTVYKISFDGSVEETRL